MSHTTSALAHQIAQHRPARSGDGFPPWLRDRVAAYVSSQLGDGVAISSLQAELGVSKTTLSRWARERPKPPAGGGFAQVVLTRVDDVAVPAKAPMTHASTLDSAPQSVCGELSLVSPNGFALRGLSFEQGLRALMVLQ